MCKKMLAMWALSLVLICFGGLTAWAAPGDLDAGFLNGQAGANGPVAALAVQPDGKVIIGGNFTTFNDVGRNRIARLNADGTLDPAFLNGLAGVPSAKADWICMCERKLAGAGWRWVHRKNKPTTSCWRKI